MHATVKLRFRRIFVLQCTHRVCPWHAFFFAPFDISHVRNHVWSVPFFFFLSYTRSRSLRSVKRSLCSQNHIIRTIFRFVDDNYNYHTFWPSYNYREYCVVADYKLYSICLDLNGTEQYDERAIFTYTEAPPHILWNNCVSKNIGVFRAFIFYSFEVTTFRNLIYFVLFVANEETRVVLSYTVIMKQNSRFPYSRTKVVMY